MKEDRKIANENLTEQELQVQKEQTTETASSTEVEKIEETQSKAAAEEEDEYDPYEGYTRDNPPPWMDEFEYIDFMMTH